jgi:hypothetical protein
MFEAIITISMTFGSFLLFCYWFRYTCHLIVSAATTSDFAASVAQAHQLGFREAQLSLSQGGMELDRLKGMLDHDYATLIRLLDQTQGAQDGIERRMLAINYSLAAVWYKTSSGISTSAARMALQEMSMVVAHFAGSLGEASAVGAAA